MGTFDYNSFVDLTRLFDLNKGQAVPPKPKARVILFSSTVLKSRNVQSRFFDPKIFIPAAKQPFRVVAAQKEKSAPKARPILRLKTKVDIAPMTPLSRRSSTKDLALAFKAEMAMLRKKAQKMPADAKSGLEEAFTQRRRHPLSDKPWSELLANVEKPAKRKNFDMAAAFKAEMNAFMAEQAKIGAAANENPAQPIIGFKEASQHKQTIRASSRRTKRMRPTLAA